MNRIVTLVFQIRSRQIRKTPSRRPPHRQHDIQAQANNSNDDMDTALGRTESVLQATRRRHKNNALNRQLWRCPASSNVYPFGKTTTLLAFNINNVRVTPASTAYTVFLDRIRICPVFVFLNTLLLIQRGLLQERLSR